MNTNTVTLHRVLRCPPDRVYRAFTTPGGVRQVAAAARLLRHRA